MVLSGDRMIRAFHSLPYVSVLLLIFERFGSATVYFFSLLFCSVALNTEGHSWKHCTKRNGKKKKKSEWIVFHSCKVTHPHTPLPPLKSGLKGTALEVHSRRAWLFPLISSAFSARAPEFQAEDT